MLQRSLLIVGIVVALCCVPPAYGAEGNNVLLILDASGSMWGQVDGVAKITTARKALSKLLTEIPPETNLGLLSYGLFSKDSCEDVHYVLSVGPGNQDKIKNLISKINPKGKTPIAAALKMAGGPLKYIKGQKHIILVSDGNETCGGDPCKVAGELAGMGIDVKIHVVGFDVGAEERRQLKCIAESGNGQYFNADSITGFNEALEAVKEEVAAIQPVQKLKEYFNDDFNGDELGEQWEVLKPNLDGFIVEEGQLLIVNSSAGNLTQDKFENLFRLTKSLPKGDWVLTVKLRIDFQTIQERIFFGLYQDKKDYLLGILSTASGSCYPGGSHSYHLYLTPTKAAGGKISQKQTQVWSIRRNCKVEDRSDYNSKMNQAQPILLRLQKKGRSYIFSIKMENAEKPKWTTLDKLTALRTKGGIVLGAYQNVQAGGETVLNIDWVKIETPE